MITIIDGIGNNIGSIENALQKLGCGFQVTNCADEIKNAKKVILPGVGNFTQSMNSLMDSGIISTIKNLKVPVLGICVGMQILFSRSEESELNGLSIIDGVVKKLNSDILPHTGWSTLALKGTSPLLKSITQDDYCYFVHSYAAKITVNTTATCNYGRDFTASVEKDNFFGVQFHPEKSATVGSKILQNFLEI